MTTTHVGDRIELGTAKDAAQRIVRCVQHDGSGAIGHERLQRHLVDHKPRGVQREVPGRGPCHRHTDRIRVVEGFHEDHLVAGIYQTEEGRRNRFGAPAGDRDVCSRINGDGRIGLKSSRNLCIELDLTDRPGVLIAAFGHRIPSRIHDELRTVEVWEALTEVDRIVPLRQFGELGEDRLPKRPKTLCDLGGFGGHRGRYPGNRLADSQRPKSMSDTARMPSPSPYSFGTMTFVLGLAIGALLGALLVADRNAGDEADPLQNATESHAARAQIAELERQLAESDANVADLQAETERMQIELESILDGSPEAEPGALQIAIDESTAKQAEIDSLSLELGAALEEIGRLQVTEEGSLAIVPYTFVLEQMHGFAQIGYADGFMYADDLALNDALDDIGDASLTDAVIVALLETDPSNTDLFYGTLQRVLNRMQASLID